MHWSKTCTKVGKAVATMGDLMTRVRERSQGMQRVDGNLATITEEFDQVQQEITSVALTL